MSVKLAMMILGITCLGLLWWTSPVMGQGPCAWVPLPSGTDGTIYAMASFDDGTGPALYVGGQFTMAGGVSANNIAKWDWNTSTWSALGLGTDSDVRALAVFDDGTGPALYAGGWFTMAGGSFTGSLARWDGAAWSPVGGGLGFWGVSDLAASGGWPGGIYVAANAGVGIVAIWNGTIWSILGITDGFANVLTVFNDGTGTWPTSRALYVGGSFTHVLTPVLAANHVAKYQASSWSALGVGPLGAGNANPVDGLAGFDDGNGPALYAVHTYGLNKWDGSNWPVVYGWGGGTGWSKSVGRGMRVFDDGTGPAVYWTSVTTTCSFMFCSSAGAVEKWDGSNASVLGGTFAVMPECLEVLDDGTGPTLWVGNGGDGTTVPFGTPAKWSCPSTIALSSTQPGGAASPAASSSGALGHPEPPARPAPTSAACRR